MQLMVSLSKNGGICRSASASQTSFAYNTRKYSEEKKKSKVVLDRGPFGSQIDYLSRLQYNSAPFTFPLSGIICTIGPASNKPECLVALMEAGMNVARCNFSHGSHEYHGQTIKNIRKAINLYCRSKGVYRDVAIALDTKGPEIRIGKFSGDDNAKIELKQGDNIKLSTKKEFETKCSKDVLYVDYSNITKIVKPGVHVFIDDGLISLLVQEVSDSEITCVVENGGKLGSQKSINLPGLPIDLPNVTERDKTDLLFGVQQKVDMVFASFIREAKGVKEIRKILGSQGQHIKIIPKIECEQALKNIDEIIEASDGIMVARGDLGIEILPEEVTIAQKSIIAKCNRVGKPVICATQMLDSMTSAPRPTRAEASDVANAIFDGADCVMLSSETASGKYPVQCVKCMASICAKVEPCLWYDRLQNEVKSIVKATSTNHLSAVSSAVAEAALASNARIIIIASPCAIVPSMVSQFRPNCPIIFLTGSPVQARQSVLHRALYPLVVEEMKSPNSDFCTVLQSGFKLVCKNKLLPPGQIVTVVAVDALKADRISFGLISVRECIQDKPKNDESKPKGGKKSTSSQKQQDNETENKATKAQNENKKCTSADAEKEQGQATKDKCGANEMTVQKKNPCEAQKNNDEVKMREEDNETELKATKAKNENKKNYNSKSKKGKKSTSSQKKQDNEIEHKATKAQNVNKKCTSADSEKEQGQATKDKSNKSSCEAQKNNDEVKMRQEICKEIVQILETKEQEQDIKNKSSQESSGANEMTVQKKNPCEGQKNNDEVKMRQEDNETEHKATKAQNENKKNYESKPKKGKKSTSSQKKQDNEIEHKATKAQNVNKKCISADSEKEQGQATKDKSNKSSCEAQKNNDEVKMRQEDNETEHKATKAQNENKKNYESKPKKGKKSTSSQKQQDNEIEHKATKAQNVKKKCTSADAEKEQGQATKDKSIKSSCEAQKNNDEVNMRQEICKEIVQIIEISCQDQDIKSESTEAQHLKKSKKAKKGQEQTTENKSTKQSGDAKKQRNQEKKSKAEAVKKMCKEVTKRLEAKIMEKCRKATKSEHEKDNSKNDGC